MSISFSGLASGLDTSSWVESLTALKRAKVETYKAEQEKLVLNQQTLSSIKNFFNSFRSVIEKVTDTRFGVGNLDLFSQNLAISSKTNILTATANSSAQEGIYNINVNNLATNTQASSNYSNYTTQTVTATATLGSTLTSLGVKAGKIGVTVNGIERTVKIGNDETIQSFIEKLGNVGAKASYNEGTGIFNVNLSSNDIRDIDNTGIVNALHLKGVNEGYTSNTLQKPVYETITEKATLNTKLYEVGIQNGTIQISSSTNNTVQNLSIKSTWTFEAFIDHLDRYGFEAELNDDGCFTLKDAVILNSGTTHLTRAFGWDNPDVSSSSQTSNKLQYTTTVVEGTVADRNTLLKDIANINNGDTIVVKNSSNVTKTITLSQTSTIGNVLDSLNNAGLYANMSNDGVVNISDGSIVGGSFDIAAAFNLTEQVNGSSTTSNTIYINKTIAQDVTSTENITYTEVVRDIQLTDKIQDIVPDFDVNKVLNIYEKDGTLMGETALYDEITFEDLFRTLGYYHIQGKLENGVITLTSDEGYYLTGLEKLGIGVASNSTSDTVTTATTKTSGTLYYTSTVNATGSDKISKFVSCNTTYTCMVSNNVNHTSKPMTIQAAVGTIVDSNGDEFDIFTDRLILSNPTYTHYGNHVSTFQDLFDTLETYGIKATMNNGVISLTSTNGAYVKGDLFEQLGIQTTLSVVKTTTGAELSSSSAVTYVGYGPSAITGRHVNGIAPEPTVETILATLTANSKLSELWDFGSSQYMYCTLTVDGTKYTFRHSADDTISNLQSNLRGYYAHSTINLQNNSLDITAQNGGSISFQSNIASYIEYTNSKVMLKPAKYTTRTILSFNTEPINENTRLSEIDENFSGGSIILYDKTHSSSKDVTLNFTKDSTIGEIKSALGNYGLELTIVDPSNGICPVGAKSIKIAPSLRYPDAYNDGYHIVEMRDGLDTVLGFDGKIGSGMSYSTKSMYYLTERDTFGVLGLSGTKYVTVVQNGTESRITINSNNTVEDFINLLAGKGIEASVGARPEGELQSISDKKFYIYSSDTSYIKDLDIDLRNALLLPDSPTYAITKEFVTANSSSKTLQQTFTNTITASSTIGSSNSGVITVQYNNSTHYVTASSNKTYGEIINELKNYNINASLSNGQITFSSKQEEKAYITDFGSAFGLRGNGYTTSILPEGTRYYNTPSDRLQQGEPFTADWDTKISQINPDFSTGSFIIRNSKGQENSISISKDDTLRDIREKLALYDISMDLSNGKATFSSNNGAYIYDLDTDTNDLFKLGNQRLYYQTTTPITTEDANKNLSSLLYKSGNIYNNVFPSSGSFNIYLYENGNRHSITVNTANGFDGLASQLAQYGINMNIDNKGQIQFSSSGDSYISVDNTSDYSKAFFNLLGINDSSWQHNSSYQSNAPIDVTNSSSQTVAAKRDTKLSDLGVTTGEYLLYKDGVKHTLYVSSDDTLGDFLNSIRSFGIESSLVTDGNATTIKLKANGDTYITASKNDESNIIAQLFGTANVDKSYTYSSNPVVEKVQESIVNATEDTKLSDINTAFIKPGNVVDVTINDEKVSININNDETIGSLIDKFNSLGINASFSDGKMVLQSGFDTLDIKVKDSAGNALNYLTYSNDLGGYSATDPNTPITTTDVIVEEKHNSVANYADYNTKLSLLNISSGTLNIYRNGEKAEINIDAEQTFNDLRSKIAAKFSDVYLRFDNGELVIGSNNADVIVGTTTDSSNFAAITGMHSDENKNSRSSRALYCVNNDSKVMTSGLFVRGNVSAGTFKVGNATITIDNNTTLDDIISQINYNDDSNATAFWDSIDGKFVIKSKATGASMINIEAGTSNFTDIMGMTFVEDGTKRMNISAQTLGQNARFSINGTNFTSVSNTVTSDISRIEGVTINLKDISKDETVTLTIEKDKETVATAISDIVDAYNELIENIDKEVSRGGNLSGESTLKLIRNQIRSLMTGSLSNTGTYKNLSSIGIGLSAASSGNIRTDNIHQLIFDKDKFVNAFSDDLTSVKKLLVGTEDSKGILTQVEDVLEQALGGVSGYFASAEKSYAKKISKLDDKIDRANKAVDRYKARLEAKFKSMDMIISKFQNQYSSFLG